MAHGNGLTSAPGSTDGRIALHVPAPGQSRAGERALPAHLPCLDGIRAIAVGGVLAVHAGVPGFQGGWLGVDLFFALSGFLITTLLLREQEANGGIRLGAFWARRCLRLMPAYYLYAAGITLAFWLWPGSLRQEHGGWTPGEYTFALWFQLMNYPPLGGIWNGQESTVHLWSLALEEQYYLLWPLFLAALLRRQRWLLPASWALFAAVLAYFLFFANDFERTVRLFGRGFSLLFASALAVTLHRRGADAGMPSWLPPPERLLPPVATLGAGVLAISWSGLLTEALVRLYLLPPLVALFALLVASLWYHPFSGPWSRLLGWQPLVYIGRISYGIYLYHQAARLLVWHATAGMVAGWPAFAAYGLRLGLYLLLAVAIASFSFEMYERSFLKLGNRFRQP